MKMTKQDYDYCKRKMSDYLLQFSDGAIIEYLEKGHNEKRIAWDLFNYAVPILFVTNHLYTYLNDSHIETAILRISKEVFK